MDLFPYFLILLLSGDNIGELVLASRAGFFRVAATPVRHFATNHVRHIRPDY